MTYFWMFFLKKHIFLLGHELCVYIAKHCTEKS